MSGSQQLLLGGSVAVPVDPYFYSVTSLLHGDGTNGGQNNTFLDSSTNNFTITRNGNTTQGSFSPFSQTGWSNYFDAGAYLSIPANSAFSFGTGDFTVEGWVNYGSVASAGFRILATAGVSGDFGVEINNSDQLAFGFAGSSYTCTGGKTTPNVWNHIAVVRSGSTIKGYINGREVGSTTNSGNITNSQTINFPATANYSGTSGYISNVRYVKGTAVYTANFTPSTTPLTAISGTSLLTCQSNRFIDNSANNFTVTRNNTVSVQPFSPFNPTTAYSTSSIGGSGYFDGSGDYLSVADNAALEMGSSNFTIECWFYPLSLPADALIADFGSQGAQGSLIPFYCSSSSVVYYISSGGGTWNIASAVSFGGTLRIGQWHHLALVRNGNTYTPYFNGVAGTTTTNAASINDAAVNKFIGSATTGTAAINGYLSDFRVVKGTAVYTANFTPPTAPLTAITNTSLLCNFTNGAIFNNAAVADYETVGNAQISTSVKKYGTGSMSFDGAGDYIVAAQTQPLAPGTGDFCYELWLYLNSTGTACVFDTRTVNNNTTGFTLLVNGSAQLALYTNTTILTCSATLSTSIWYHVAVTRTAGNIKVFLNGTQIGTLANTSNFSDKSFRVGQYVDGTGSLNGYVDDVRISNGISRYPYNFTPPTAEFPNIGGTVTLTADPYYEYTTLLLPGNGTNGAQNNTFLDSSTNAFTITRNGNATQGTFSPFSQTGWSAYFDGTGDYLVTPSNAALSSTLLGSDFTIETWLYLTAAPSGGAAIWTNSVSNSDGFSSSYVTTNLAIGTGKVGVNEFATANNILALNQWNHFACVRNGATVYIYVNGTQVASGAASTYLNTSATKPMTFGSSYQTSPAAISGYFSNIRVVSSAVYTANFTPPTVPLTAISNTQLLTCQSNRFIDNSTNAFAITRNGDVSVQAFSPFNPTASWSAATYGGSGYFDGSGDYVALPNSSISLGSGDCAVEFWCYITGEPTTNPFLFDNYGNGSARLYAYYDANTMYLNADTGTRSTTFNYNSWNLFQFTRTSGTGGWYLNGSLISTTFSTSGTIDLQRMTIGAAEESGSINTSQWTQGYISNFRASTTNRSTSAPTAPFTSDANTKVLLNFTNAGIYDATSKNDLETVGNAQISTTQSKFGGSSMYFDGTGDWLLGRTSPNLDMGSGDYTFECWFYLTNNLSTYRMFVSSVSADGSGAVNYVCLRDGGTGGQVEINANGGSFRFNLNNSVSQNTWTHIAVARYGTTVTCYINGISLGTNTSSAAFNLGIGGIYVGRWGGGTAYEWPGYIDDLRITKGIARYTSNFTPPTTAFLTL